MIRKNMYEVRSYRRTGPYNDEVVQGTSGPFETRGTAERAVIAFAQSGQCTRADHRLDRRRGVGGLSAPDFGEL